MVRHPYVIPLRFSIAGRIFNTTTRALGVEGVFVRCLAPPKPNTKVRLELSIPGGVEVVEGLVGDRCMLQGESGFWADFVRLPPTVRVRIRQIVEAAPVREPAAVATPPPLAKASAPPTPPSPRSPEAQRSPEPPRPAPAGPPPPPAVAPVDNRRATPRVPAQFKVRFRTAREFVEEFSLNISAGGLFLRSDNPPGRDEQIELELHLPGLEQPVRTRALVVHTMPAARAQELGVPAGAGLQFLDADAHFREQIDRYLDRALSLAAAEAGQG